MKLTKDQSQKIVLGIMMMIGLVYAFFEFMLRPVGLTRAAAIKAADVLQPKILAAKGQIAKTRGLSLEGPKARELVDQVKAMIPDGSPVAWFPPRVADFYKGKGMDRVSTRMNNEIGEKDLAGFRRLNWGIEVPRADFVPFAAALAEFENAEPLLEIQSISIETNREDPGHQRIVLNVNNLVHL